MKIVFTVAAKHDLDELRSYLQPLSPTGLSTITMMLEQRIASIADNPAIGRPSPRQDIRELIEPKFGFLIPYHVRDGTIFILRCYRSSRRPLDYSLLNLP